MWFHIKLALLPKKQRCLSNGTKVHTYHCSERQLLWDPWGKAVYKYEALWLPLVTSLFQSIMQAVPSPMFYFGSRFCCPILYTVCRAFCCSSNLFKMLFHYYFYLSWKMEMGNNGKEDLLVESLLNLHSRKLSYETVYWPQIQVHRGEGKEPLLKSWIYINLFTSLHYGHKVFLENCRTILGYHWKQERVWRMQKTNVLKMKHEQFCNDKAY